MTSTRYYCICMRLVKDFVLTLNLILGFQLAIYAERPSLFADHNPPLDDNPPSVICPPNLTVGVTGQSCNATFALPQVEFSSVACGGAFDVEISSPLGNSFGPYFDIGSGIYPVHYLVHTPCGDTSTCDFLVLVKDTKPPLPILKSTLVGNITANGSVRFRARQTNQNSSDNCTASPLLRFSFSENNPDDTLRVFGCHELGQHQMTVTVFDESGNKATALTKLKVLDGMGYCQRAVLQGVAKSELGEEINGVQILLSTADQAQNFITTDDGSFRFENLLLTKPYRLAPYKNDNPINGVNTYDLYLLKKHLMGEQLLDSPNELIAADVDRDQQLTFTDLNELRKLVLGEYSVFPNNTSWRFSTQLPNEQLPDNPLTDGFAEEINFPYLSQGNSDIEIIGIKIGDINKDAVPNDLKQYSSQDRSETNPFLLIADNQYFKEGDIVKISFAVPKQSLKAEGFQLTLEFDMNNLAFQSAIPSANSGMAFENIGLAHVHEGILTLNFEGNANSADAERQIIQASFTAKTNGRPSHFLHVSDRVVPAQAYDKDGKMYNVNLKFNEPNAEGGLQLFTNTPNPFIEMTLLRFFIPDASEVILRIFDAEGCVVKEKKDNFLKGENQFMLNRPDIGKPGVYVYQLETKFGSASRKLIMF